MNIGKGTRIVWDLKIKYAKQMLQLGNPGLVSTYLQLLYTFWPHKCIDETKQNQQF